MRDTELQPIVDYLESLTNELASLRKRVVDVEGVSMPNLKFTTGSVVFAGASGYPTQDNAQFFWDDTDNRLGIGTATPGLQLESKMKGLFPALNVAEKDTTNRRATMGFGVNGETATTGWIMGQGLNNNTTKDFFLNDLTAAVTRLYIDTSGNVGVGGISTVNGKLHAKGTGAGNIQLLAESDNTGSGRIEIRDGAGTQNKMAFVLGTGTATDGNFGVYDARQAQFRMIFATNGNVGINSTGTASHKLHVADPAAAALELESSNTTGFSRARFATNSRTWGIVTEGSAGGTFPGKLAVYDYTAGGSRLLFDSADSYVYGDSIVFANLSGTTRWLINSSGNLIPVGAGSLSIGSAAAYVNEVNYKTLTDRGCLALIPEWEMPDGRKVSNLQVFREMKPHGRDKTIYGETKLDYNSVPKHSHKAAPIAEEDVFEDVDGPEPGKKVKKLKHRKGEKMGEDGVEMTSIFSMMIGAIRELADRMDRVENKTK